MSPRGLTMAIVVLAAVLLAARSRADDGRGAPAPLSLDDVLSSAERSFPLLKAAELEQAIAAGDYLSAEGGFDLSWKTRGTVVPIGYYDSVRVESMVEKPTALWGASAFAGWKLGRGNFAIYDGRLQTLEHGELRAGVNVPLWRNGPVDRRRANLARAGLGRELAGLSVTEQRIEVRRAAAHRYWAWVAAGRRLAIAEELLRTVAERDAGLGLQVESGDLPRIERTDNARAIEQRTAQVASARRGLEKATIELALFVRDASGRPAPPSSALLPTTLPEPPRALPATAADDLATALSRRPEPQQLRLRLRQNEIELGWANNQLAPGIDMQLAGSQDLGRPMVERPDLSKPVLEVSLLIEIPIQTRLMRGRADAAAAMVSRLEQQRSFARDRVEADVRDAQSALRGAHDRIAATRREVRLALELEDAERTRFAQGDSTVLIVNIREQQTAEAKLREVEALLDYHRAVADSRAARGE